MFDAVYRRWSTLAEDARPKLIVYGLNPGSFGAEAGFAGTLADSSIANLQARTDGVLLAGPTHDNPVRMQISGEREDASPVWRPVFEGGTAMRWFNSAAELAALAPGLGSTATRVRRPRVRPRAGLDLEWAVEAARVDRPAGEAPTCRPAGRGSPS